MGRIIVKLEEIYGIEHGNNQRTSQNANSSKSQKDLQKDNGISKDQWNRYKKLTELIPEFQDLAEAGDLKTTLGVMDEWESFFDDISGVEYEQFKMSIQDKALLVAPDLTVISGHQRLRIAKELGFDMVPIIIRHDIQTEDDKLLCLIAMNFGRRKNDDKKTRLAAKVYVEQRGLRHGGDRKSSSDYRNLKLTQEQIANELNVSVSTLNEMLDIERKLTPEIKEILDTGAFTKTTASKILVKLSQDEQQELIETYGKEIIQGFTQKQMQEYVDKIKGLERTG